MRTNVIPAALRLLGRFIIAAVAVLASGGRRLKQAVISPPTPLRNAVDLLLLPSDIVKSCLGYRAHFNRLPRLLNPKSFNEWIQHDKLFQRNPVQVIRADKLRMREFVAQTIGPSHLPRLYWTGKRLSELTVSTLPRQFVIKANNGCGSILIVRDRNAVNWEDVCETTQRWTADDYSDMHGEWLYRWMEPQLLIEEFLADDSGEPLPDFKVWCFHGIAVLVQCVLSRHSRMRSFWVDRRGRRLKLRREGICDAESILCHCEGIQEMIPLAEAIAEAERFVRVDFYYRRVPLVGEITYHPEAGLFPFEPRDVDDMLGLLMNTPRPASYVDELLEPFLMKSASGVPIAGPCVNESA